MTFQATITITPADAKYCGECRWCESYGCDGDGRECTLYDKILDRSHPDDEKCGACGHVKPGFFGMIRPIRCPACLAAEKAAGALLRQCPRCKGTGDAVAECEPQEYPGPCRACLESPVPGWIPVEVDHG
jgi:phage FluMu protein Com